MGTWHIPWRERGRSGPVHDSFLWQDDRLYVMDNHRLALWCWWQHLDESPRWSFHHIDRHFDALWQIYNPWPEHFRPEHRTDLDAFRRATFETGDGPFELYRWDAITSALWSLHRNVLTDVSFATANEGDAPPMERAQHIDPWRLLAHLDFLADADEPGSVPRIIDVDLDYFARHDLNGAFGQVFSDEYLEQFGASLRRGYESGRFGVITVALSPTTTGSWPLAERLLGKVLASFPEAREILQAAPKGNEDRS